jgi:histidinol dehydrogenase
VSQVAATPATPAAPPAARPRLRLRRIELSTDGGEMLVRSLSRRAGAADPAVRLEAARFLAEVRAGGDDAVLAANRQVGGGLADGRLVLPRAELEGARERLPSDVRAALEQAIDHVERFATTQRPATTRTTIVAGIEIERRWQPLDRVGCYVPGGTAPYPSSLVMTVVPARVAGVPTIVVASPADREGRLDPVIAGAADLLGVDALVVAGGAQAIGALAFGLPGAGLEPVDRIVGPGNAWVTAAKLEVSAEVSVDLPAGPSEGMVLADGDADPVLVAADLVTQAEHGPDSPAILVTTSRALADRVEVEIEALLVRLERRDILARSLADHGAIVLAPDLTRALDVVNAYAPEHLSVDVADPERAVAAIRHAGSVFVGRWAPESAGDYATGANHVLPTGGLARACSPLAVDAFGHYLQVQRITRDGLARIRRSVVTLATAEGLTAHRNAIEARFRDEPPRDDDALPFEARSR